MQSRAFGAKSAKISGVVGVAFYANNTITMRANNHAASHAAVTTRTFGFFNHFNKSFSFKILTLSKQNHLQPWC